MIKSLSLLIWMDDEWWAIRQKDGIADSEDHKGSTDEQYTKSDTSFRLVTLNENDTEWPYGLLWCFRLKVSVLEFTMSNRTCRNARTFCYENCSPNTPVFWAVCRPTCMIYDDIRWSHRRARMSNKNIPGQKAKTWPIPRRICETIHRILWPQPVWPQ